MAAANVCAVRRKPAAVGQLAAHTSSLEEDAIDRDILQMLLGINYGNAASAHAASQPQQSQHADYQQQGLRSVPQHPRQPQNHASCCFSFETEDAFAPNHRMQACRLSTMPSADTEISSDFSHVQSTIDSPQTAKHSTVAHLQQQWSRASSNLQHSQSRGYSYPVHLLQGNIHAREPLEQPAGSGWPVLITSDLLMDGMVSAAARPAASAEFLETTHAVQRTAGPYYYTPVADPMAALGPPAADLAAAAVTAVTDAYVPITSSALPPRQQQRQRLVTPPLTPPAAADATDGSSKRGRRSDSSSRSNSNNNSNKKRQRLPPPGEKALESLQHKYAAVTEENAALRAQVSVLHSEKNELVDRMSSLTHKWQATVAELARLHRENLALLESLPVVVPRFRGY